MTIGFTGDRFQPFTTLPAEFIPASLQLMKFSEKFVKLDGDKQLLDWRGFKEAVDDYKGNDLSVDIYDTSNINQHTQAAHEMVDKIARLIHEKFSASVDLPTLTENVLRTFTNLKVYSENNTFTSFSESHSSGEYRIILFGVPDESTHSQFQTLVVTVTITVDIKEESSWFGISETTTKNFGAQIDVARLNVAKSFKSPID